ncbi:hypothetical protein BAUCODRAFT_43663, partial [Baudoinia panamericana UAMH 10762]
LEARLKLIEESGDIFDAPPNALLIHACNCQGSWGAGIAKAFKDSYGDAYHDYVDHCNENKAESLIGTALLIPPAATALKPSNNKSSPERKHFVGCLFTSRFYGKRKDSPTKILDVSGPAMEDLLSQVDAWNAKAKPDSRIGEVRMCKINSGLFAVPWPKTKAVLKSINVSKRDVTEIKVIS